MRIGILAMILLSSSLTFGQDFDVQGHRGARGLLPENTIPGFLKALDLGVTTLELDVVISKDGKVVVSHEPWMSSRICLDPENHTIPTRTEKDLNIFNMNYEEISTYDCGTLDHSDFPEQEKIKVHKPLLSEVLVTTEKYIKDYTNYEVDYNIEIKSTPSGDGTYHPGPEEFSDLVYQLVDQYIPLERVIIQSFDFRVLRYWHQRYPDVRLAALIENVRSVDTNLERLGFEPDIYSSSYRLLNRRRIKALKEMGIKVIPWTINDPRVMRRFINLGVDGIITDYPNRLADILVNMKNDGDN